MKCLLCQNDLGAHPEFHVRDRLGLVNAEFAVYRCRTCATPQLAPPPSPEQIAALYPDNYNFKLHNDDNGVRRLAKRLEWTLFYQTAYRNSLRFVRRHVPSESFSFFDVGCGNGLRLKMFADAGCRAAGNELSGTCVAYARDELGLPVVQGELGEVLFTLDDRYDAVGLFALLEHLPNPRQVIEQAASLLVEDGVLALQIPIIPSLQSRLLGKRVAAVREMPRHVFIPTLEGLDHAMAPFGLERVAVEPLSAVELASIFSLGLYYGSSATDVYAEEPDQDKQRAAAPGGFARRRVTGWLLAACPGLPVALIERCLGRGAENLILYRRTR